jgi:hypothetical protein
LQKYRFFARASKPILCFHQIEEATDMAAFWTHLHRLAQGQLFNGGHLDWRTLQPTKTAEPSERPCRPALRDTPARCLPHTQIVACR